MMSGIGISFRFNAVEHEYVDLATGAILPHITGMLERTGWVDSTFYTEESRERGHAVHKLTADYDLGALEVESVRTPFRGYLLAHVKAMQILQPEIVGVEEPGVHPVYKFGGRPDRRVRVRRRAGVLELKSGVVEPSHPIQTALQAILVAADYDLPPEHLARFCLYLRDNGRFTLEEHTSRHDFTEAQRVIRTCCTH